MYELELNLSRQDIGFPDIVLLHFIEHNESFKVNFAVL